jgi:hypothetical protein
MGYSLKEFCRDTTAILKSGSRQHVDKVKSHMERLLNFGCQTAAPAVG